MTVRTAKLSEMILKGENPFEFTKVKRYAPIRVRPKRARGKAKRGKPPDASMAV